MCNKNKQVISLIKYNDLSKNVCYGRKFCLDFGITGSNDPHFTYTTYSDLNTILPFYTFILSHRGYNSHDLVKIC